MTHTTRTNILKYASLGLIGFGVLNFLSLFPFLQPVMGWFLDLAYLSPFGTDHQLASPAGALWIAISGGLLAGWGTTLWLISSQVYSKDPSLGSRIILTGVAVWFVIDSAGSIAVGAPFNAVLNFAFLLMFEIPLLWPKGKPTTSTLAA
ncbi:MAG: hypothetical protein ABJH63_05670 [Rhizobiaceae bacterium]